MALDVLPASPAVLAHVKWFSEFSYEDRPRSLAEIADATVVGLLVLSMVSIGLLVVAERWLGRVPAYSRVNDWLSSRQRYSSVVMRVAMGATLLLSWQANSLLAPELLIPIGWVEWVGWFQFVLALLLLFPKTTPIAGVGLVALYGIGVWSYGAFHMLDYVSYLGIAAYLIVCESSRPRVRDAALPLLFAGVGFSLMWLGLEKLVYPDWALYLLAQNPHLTLGLPPAFFLKGAAFVELSLGFLLIIGLLERPLSLTITLVFFSTTLIFGKLEVIGHTPLHAALVVFLLNGPGRTFTPPIFFHKRLPMRVAFASVNFAIVVAALAAIYSYTAQQQYQVAVSDGVDGGRQAETTMMDVGDAVPTFTTLEVIAEEDNSYTLHAELDNWRFTPELTGQASVPSEGHGHVYLNGTKAGRLYGPYLFLGTLRPGGYTVEVQLNGNDHTMFTKGGEVIAGTLSFDVPDRGAAVMPPRHH